MDVQAVSATDASRPNTPAAPVPGQGSAPEDHAAAAPAHQHQDKTLSDTLGALFGGSHDPAQSDIDVSYRVSKDHAIITVFTDHATGREVAQVPSAVLEQLAVFFDQHSGVTLDRNA